MKQSEPWSHAIYDNFFTVELLEQLLAQWPTEGWHQHGHLKRSFPYFDKMPAVGKMLISFGNGMVDSISKKFGIPDLLSDPTLFGAGLHETMPGGKLGIHVDFNRLPNEGLYRRVNMLLFLNKDWQDDWGGHLELWSDVEGERPRVKKTIAPVFNRCVIFPTTDQSWHGHPEPLRCPEGVSRKSVAWYFYSQNSPEGYQQARSTIYAGK